MKKVILSLIIFSFFFITAVFAQETDLPNPGTLPDSTFYFLKSWKESIQTFFIFGAENKAKQFLHLAEVRLAEYQKMIEKEKTEIAEKTLEKYERQLNQALEKADQAKEKGEDVEKLKEAISEKIIKHQEVLIELLNKVPEEAKKGIENAIEMSQKGFDNAIEAVSGEKKEELERKAEEIKVKVETADWKTYRNEEYGFEVKYPKEWREPLETKPPYPAEGVLYLYLVGFYKSTAPEGFEVTIYEKPSHLDYAGLDEGVGLPQKGKEIPEVCPKPTREASIGIENYPAKIVYISPEDVCSRETYFYILQKGNYNYVLTPIPTRGIGYVGYDGKAETEKYLPEFYQALSTFKFIEK